MFLEGVTPYALPPAEKEHYLIGQMEQVVEHHRHRCPPYRRFVDDWDTHCSESQSRLENVPFLPVSVFKDFELRSTTETTTSVSSSATSTGVASRVFVDKPTRKRQSLSANKIWVDFLGSEKRPFLVFDLESTVRGSQAMSARAAAILSVAHLASKFYFVMRQEADSLKIDTDKLAQAVKEIGQEPLVAYGFTYILYQAHRELQEIAAKISRVNSESVFLHSGGWKRLQSLAVDKPELNRTVADVWGISPQRVIDFYGLIEQVGVLFPDCSAGLKHVPYWSEIIIRRNDSCEPADVGETGLIQLMNCLPLAGPNHSILTEDLGTIVAEDGCRCGRRGRAFRFEGRAARSELRGCSDVAR